MRVRQLSSLALLVLVGCGPAPQPKPPTPPPVKKADAGPPVETPSRWALRSSELTGRVDLGKEGILYFGRNGERWLKESEAKPPAHATTFASEEIVAAKKTNDGFLFLTTSGAVYTAPTPLGALGPRRPPPPRLSSIDVGKDAFVAIRAGKEIVRSVDGGLSWAPVKLPKAPGVLVRVVMNPGGVGAALFAPQRLLFTSDDGVTWNEAAAPHAANPRLSATETGVYLQNAEGWFELKRDVAKFEKGTAPPVESIELTFPGHPNTAWAESVANGTGAVTANKHYELIWNDGDDTGAPGGISVYVEELGKPATQKVLQRFPCSSNAKLAASGNTIVVACENSDSGAMEAEGGGDDGPSSSYGAIELHRSDDGGASWKKDGKLTYGGRPDERMWLGPDGTLVFKGACLVGAATCTGHGVVRPGGASEFVDIKVDGIPSFYAMGFGKAGSVYAVGTSDSDDGRKAFVFTSHDSGRTFERQLFPGAEVVDIDPGLQFVKRRGALAIDASGNLAAAAIAYEGSWFLASTPDDGKTVVAGALPPVNALSFAGLRGFGVGGGGKGYETFDGGKSWTQVPGIEDETSALACGTHGCLLGFRAARVGWDLAKAGGDWTKPPKEAPAPKKTAYRTPFTCKAEGTWSSFVGYADANALLADSGDGVRMAMTLPDPKLRGVKALVGKQGGKQGLEVKEVTLLAALPAPKEKEPEKLKAAEKAIADEWRFTYASVPGGIVALRWKGPAPKPVVTKKPGAQPPPPVKDDKKDPKKDPKKDAKPKEEETTSVEVGWWIAKTNTVAKAKIDKMPVRLNLEAYSIGNDGGLTLAAVSGYTPQTLYFVGKGGKVDSTPLPAKLPSFAPFRNAQKTAGKFVYYVVGSSGLYEQWTKLDKDKAEWTRDALTLWPGWTPGLGSARYLREPGDPGLLMFTPRTESHDPAAVFLAVQPGAAPKLSQALLQTDIDDKKVCGKDSAGKPRLVLPYVAGSRHPVTVTLDDGKSFVAATSDAIVRVDGENACVSGWTSDRTWADGGSFDVYLPADDLAHAVLSRRKGSEISVRPMNCTMAAGPLPESLTEKDGFTE
ncbi:MAG: hypothetical protein JNL79_03075 [Myxococcales bacterium]|nr:hypothetical protein [Myxococcales bacterium]